MPDIRATTEEIARMRRSLVGRTAGGTVAVLVSMGASIVEARGVGEHRLLERVTAARTTAEIASSIPGKHWKFAQATPKDGGGPSPKPAPWNPWRNS